MSELNRRAVARLALGGGATLVALSLVRNTWAQTWPARPIMLIVPYPPGGVADPEARLVADALSRALGQSFVVQNKPGAAGQIATEFVAHAEPDGYTFLFATSAQITILPLTQPVRFASKDLAPVSAIAEGPMVLGISTSLAVDNLKDFIALIRASPGKYSYASGGIGSVSHLTGAAFAKRMQLDMVHVPYRGGGPAVLDFLAGRVAMYFGNVGELLPHREDKRIRFVAVSSRERMPQLPELPALAEQLPNFSMSAWRGVVAPAGAPQSIIDKVSSLIQRASKNPAVITSITNLGDEVLTTTSAQHAAIIARERKVYADAIAAAGLGRE